MNNKRLSHAEIAGRAARGKAERLFERLFKAQESGPASNDPAEPEEDRQAA